MEPGLDVFAAAFRVTAEAAQSFALWREPTLRERADIFRSRAEKCRQLAGMVGDEEIARQ